jgi:isopentenyldiphosphate isomerase
MSKPTIAQDPDERFDVIDVHGVPTGVTKRRADVHRDGDWHRAIHVWIYGVHDGGPFMMLQRRGLEKDSWPGALDASAAGHFTAGESPEDAFREIEEELGIVPDVSALQYVGTRIIAGEVRPHRLDREYEEVYLLRDDRLLSEYWPNAAEVDALVKVPIADWLSFLFAETESCNSTLRTVEPDVTSHHHITIDQLIPSPDRYYQRVAVACDRALRGDRYLVV